MATSDNDINSLNIAMEKSWLYSNSYELNNKERNPSVFSIMKSADRKTDRQEEHLTLKSYI